MSHYSLAFIFNKSLSKVLLIHKTHPEWQAGKINGIGGKIEPGETPVDCIVRETAEETGLVIPKDQWTPVGVLSSAEWEVSVFGAVYTGSLAQAKSLTGERIEWIAHAQLPKNVIYNLRWLIPMTMDKLINNDPHGFTLSP